MSDITVADSQNFDESNTPTFEQLPISVQILAGDVSDQLAINKDVPFRLFVWNADGKRSHFDTSHFMASQFQKDCLEAMMVQIAMTKDSQGRQPQAICLVAPCWSLMLGDMTPEEQKREYEWCMEHGVHNHPKRIDAVGMNLETKHMSVALLKAAGEKQWSVGSSVPLKDAQSSKGPFRLGRFQGIYHKADLCYEKIGNRRK